MNVDELTAGRRNGPYYTNYQPSRYLLRLPGDDKAKGRTRATTFVKTIEDDSALKPWLATMAVVGTFRSTAVRSEWSSLLTRHPDPWYDTDESKEQCRILVEKSQEAGGSAERRDTGTNLHDILEAVGTGTAPVSAVPDEWRPHVEAALALLDAEGFDIVPHLCEQSIINRAHGELIVGRFDLMLQRRATGRLHIGDYKTGGSTWRRDKRTGRWLDGYSLSDGAHAAQMALYAGAESIIVWPENQWDECDLIPMPAVDQTEAVIVHLPSTEPATCSLRYLDLDVGRQRLELCAAVRTVRRHKPLLRRVGATEPGVAEQVTKPAPSSKRDELEQRAKALIAHSPAARIDLARHWPTDVPTFKGGHEHTGDQLAAIDRVVTFVENSHDTPFLVPPVGSDPAPTPARPEPVAVWEPPDEGRRITDDEYEAIKAMCADAPAVLDQWHSEAMEARRAFTLRGARTERRAEIIVAALEVARHLHDPAGDDLIDAALVAVAGVDRQAGMTIGAVLGSLTIVEARRLAELARAFGAGEINPITDEHGVYRFAA